MRKLNEYIIVVLILLIIFFIGTINILNETTFFEFFEPSDWLTVIANIFTTILTVGVTIYIFESGDKREKLKIKQENKPLLVLGISTYNDIDISNVVDLEDREIPLNEMKKDSNVTLPLINGGRTPIFNISYYFSIENVEEIKLFYKNSSIKDISPKLEFKRIEFNEKKLIKFPIYMKMAKELVVSILR